MLSHFPLIFFLTLFNPSFKLPMYTHHAISATSFKDCLLFLFSRAKILFRNITKLQQRYIFMLLLPPGLTAAVLFFTDSKNRVLASFSMCNLKLKGYHQPKTLRMCCTYTANDKLSPFPLLNTGQDYISEL